MRHTKMLHAQIPFTPHFFHINVSGGPSLSFAPVPKITKLTPAFKPKTAVII